MTTIPWVDVDFPKAVGRYRKTSDPDDYNCIAYAIGDTSDWWSHEKKYKWVGDRSPLIEALVNVFIAKGYKKCLCASRERGYEKVALYAKGHLWTHAAIQLENGRWSSKLGGLEDIEHETAGCICNDEYGEVYCYMKRPKSSTSS